MDMHENVNMEGMMSDLSGKSQCLSNNISNNDFICIINIIAGTILGSPLMPIVNTDISILPQKTRLSFNCLSIVHDIVYPPDICLSIICLLSV